jgi:hypothetical protein
MAGFHSTALLLAGLLALLPRVLALLARLLLTGLLLVLIGHSSISFVEPFNARQRAAPVFVSVPA